jgi:hypothetical protein
MRKIILSLSFFIALMFPIEARADNIIITSGSLTVGSLNGGSFSLVGQNFSATGGVAWGAWRACFPCRPGEQIDIESYNVGGDVFGGTVTINGVTTRVSYGADLRFVGSLAAPLVDPSLVDPSTSLVTYETAFVFSGRMQACTQNVNFGNCGTEIFNGTLSGQGIASVVLASYFDPIHGRLFRLSSVTYQFQNATPTPEPMTMVLLGTGLAGVAAHARRRSNRQAKESVE